MTNERQGRCTVVEVTWDEAAPALSAVRRAVFIEEQGVPEPLEWDELDASSLHVLARADGRPVGTGRLLPDGRIGRMAVLPQWRRQGVGSEILERLLAASRRRGDRECRLHAQVHALPFYARHGFVAAGAQFMEAGIPHQEMVRRHPPG